MGLTSEHVHHDDAPLGFDRKAYVGAGLYFAYVATWYLLGQFFGVPAREITFWLVAVTMTAAHCYYVIQAYATVDGRRHWLDLAFNFAQGVGVAIVMVGHLGDDLGLRASLGLVALVAAAHPVLTDLPHMRRWFRTDAARYVPPACVIIDFSAAALALLALAS
jgi:hypothetical protein